MTDTPAVADWPHIQALTRPDGTGELTINGTSHPIETASVQQARDEIVRRVVDTATKINRPVRVATTGPEGCIIVTPDGVMREPAEPVERVLDTTGAGDLFAAGFLFGYTRAMSLAQCARLGSIAAAEVISHVGPRPLVALKSLIP